MDCLRSIGQASSSEMSRAFDGALDNKEETWSFKEVETGYSAVFKRKFIPNMVFTVANQNHLRRHLSLKLYDNGRYLTKIIVQLNFQTNFPS